MLRASIVSVNCASFMKVSGAAGCGNSEIVRGKWSAGLGGKLPLIYRDGYGQASTAGLAWSPRLCVSVAI